MDLTATAAPLAEGAVYDSNRYTLTAALRRLDVDLLDLGVVRDDPKLLEQAFDEAARCADVVITSGGVLETTNITMGANAQNVVTNDGGVYQFLTAKPTITKAGTVKIAPAASAARMATPTLPTPPVAPVTMTGPAPGIRPFCSSRPAARPV